MQTQPPLFGAQEGLFHPLAQASSVGASMAEAPSADTSAKSSVGPSQAATQAEVMERLKQGVRRLEKDLRPDFGRVTSGSRGVDGLVGEGGFRRGTLVEWLGELGSGATALASVAAREASRGNGSVVVIDHARRFYPPAAAGLGIRLDQLIVVRPECEKDYHWAVCQALGCRGVSAVLCWPQKLDSQSLRRWQLAAETGGSLGLLVRPTRVRGQPTWADVQLLVQPRPTRTASVRSATQRRLRVELCYCRSGKTGGRVEMDFDFETGLIHETSALPVVAQLADSAAVARSAGA